MGFLDFLFSNVVTNNQKKALRNYRSKTISNHDNYGRGYEDGYDDCYSDHDNSFDEHPVDGYCEHEDYENHDFNACDDNECDW